MLYKRLSQRHTSRMCGPAQRGSFVAKIGCAARMWGSCVASFTDKDVFDASSPANLSHSAVDVTTFWKLSLYILLFRLFLSALLWPNRNRFKIAAKFQVVY